VSGGGAPTEQALTPPSGGSVSGCVHGSGCQGIPGSYFGHTVSISADGSTAIVGAPDDDWDNPFGSTEEWSDGFTYEWARTATSTGGKSGSGNPGGSGGSHCVGRGCFGTPGGSTSGGSNSGSGGSGGSGKQNVPLVIPVYGPKVLINPVTGGFAIAYFCTYGLSFTDPCIGGVTVPVYCLHGADTTPYTPCFGVAGDVASTAARTRKHRSKVVRVLARAHFVIQPGHRGKIQVRLTKAGMQVLRHRKRLSVNLVISITQGSHHSTRTEHVVLTLAPLRHHK
jgi:hypothetical protein